MTQQQALNLLMMGKNIYLTGQAGSGKTYLLNLYIDFLKKHKVSVAITASTGIGGTHLTGRTIHSWSGIGIRSHLQDHQVAQIASKETTRSRIQNAKILIIDEISMFHSYRLDLVNRICKYARKDERPFGGLQVILCGDFFQLPPVNEVEFEESSFAYKSEAWEDLDLVVCYLDEQHRQQDESFLRILNEIRSQDLNEHTFEKLHERLNKEIGNNVKPTKLYTTNADVDAINNFELQKITKPEHRYIMTSRGDMKLIETLKKGCLAPEELLIKEEAVVMFVKNNPSKGYVNGTLGKVSGYDNNGYPLVETYSGKSIVASPVSWRIEENDIVLAEINQIPLRLAWAITIHKSQGMSLDAAEIDLSKSFAYGMGYVALSRVRSLEGMKLLGINQKAFMVDEEITKLDKVLKKTSNEYTLYLKNLDETQINEMQQKFLKSIVPKNQAANVLKIQ